MDTSTNIVWICQWYPHEDKPYVGDFIQRHAQAVSKFLPITIFACFEHATKKGVFVTKSHNLTEVIIYYKPIATGIDKVDKAIRWLRWFTILKKQLLQYKKQFGIPQLLHCHILLNTGWLGLWAKRKWKTPFVATEHWSGFMPKAVNGYERYNNWSKKKLNKIIKAADIVTCVSDALIERLRLIEPAGNFVRIPNVVNAQIFNFNTVQKKSHHPVFIHISTGSPQKNVADLLAGFAIFCKKYPMAKLMMVCPKNEKKYPVPIEIEQNIEWKKDMPQAELADLMRVAHACILYSTYETFGCVIVEANALGIPVIVSDIPVLQELVKDGENGVLVTLSSPLALSEAMEKIINTFFNHQSISEQASKQFSYENVAPQFVDIYKKTLTK